MRNSFATFYILLSGLSVSMPASVVNAAPAVSPSDIDPRLSELVPVDGSRNFGQLTGQILEIIDLLVLLLFALALVVIMWGLIKSWILNAGNPEEVKKGQQIALAGTIGLIIMVAVWGIVKLFSSGLFNAAV